MMFSTKAAHAAGRLAAVLLTCMLVLGLTSATSSAKPVNANAGNKLTCFDGTTDGGYGGLCSITGGVATLDNTDGNVSGSYSGVYIQGSNLNGKSLANVGQLSFNYTGVPTNGSPRISLPLDTNGDGSTDVYAFTSAFWCNDGAGFLDAINNPGCQIFVGNEINPYVGWAALMAAYPTATVGPDGSLPFIIADDAGLWTVGNVHLGKATRTTGK